MGVYLLPNSIFYEIAENAQLTLPPLPALSTFQSQCIKKTEIGPIFYVTVSFS